MITNKPQSSFRHWLLELWWQHKEERQTWGAEPLTLSQYLREYQGWLRQTWRQHRDSK